MTRPLPSTPRPYAGLLWLIVGLVWMSLVRVPLLENARDHLDSDLAVDGLTLLDAQNGHWRWHYPATPFVGTPPVLLSWVPASLWGTTPTTLVAGGVIAWGLVIGATFVLNRWAFGASVASWGLVPLAFASTGLVWLSGRITGGHLLAVAWHAGAFAGLWSALTRGGWPRALILGLWAGFGLYIDTMFAITWVGLGVASVVAWWGARVGIARGFVGLLAFALGAGVGVAPRFIGQRVDPHNAYGDQFTPQIQPEILARNGKLLALDCLPRLAAGHRLPWLESDPDPTSLPGGRKRIVATAEGFPWFELVVTVVGIGFFGRGLVALAVGRIDFSREPDGSNKSTQDEYPIDQARRAASRGVRWGLIVSSLAVVGGFLVAPNITNSDNYRYLVFLVVPFSTGVGLWLAGLAGRGRFGLALAGAPCRHPRGCGDPVRLAARPLDPGSALRAVRDDIKKIATRSSRVPSPESRVPSPESRVPSPESRVSEDPVDQVVT